MPVIGDILRESSPRAKLRGQKPRAARAISGGSEEDPQQRQDVGMAAAGQVSDLIHQETGLGLTDLG